MNNINWIENFKNEIKNYSYLHYDKINKINIYSIYCIDNNIEYIKKNCFDISNNYLNSNTLLKFIIDNNKQNNINFIFNSLYKYNFDITYNDILTFNNSNNYFTKINIFKDIYFDDCIKYFNNLNSIFIFYNNNSNVNNKSYTKKIKPRFLNKTKKKI